MTPREIEVLSLVAAGNSNKLIAARLKINEETAKTHIKSILAKLDANDRTHAVTWDCNGASSASNPIEGFTPRHGVLRTVSTPLA